MKYAQTLLICLLIATSGNAKEIYDPEQAKSILQGTEISTRLEALETTDSILANTERLFSDQTINTLEREYLLFQSSYRIANMPPSPELKQLLQKLSGYESQAYWSTKHVGRTKEVLAYPIAGNAAAILTDWHLDEQTARLMQNNTVYLPAIQAYLTDPYSAEQNRVTSRLINSLSQDELNKLMRWGHDHATWLGDEPLALLVSKTADPVLRSHLLQRLRQKDRANASMIHQLGTIARGMTDDSRFHTFSELITSPAYATTALHLLATTSKSHQATNDSLLTYLADKQIGGDAAVALSRRLTPSLTNQLAEYLNSDDKVLARRAELALSLAEDDQARAIIRQFRIQQSVSDNSETD